jgi:hypothetical protein
VEYHTGSLFNEADATKVGFPAVILLAEMDAPEIPNWAIVTAGHHQRLANER